MTFILDAGALVAVDRGDRVVSPLLRREILRGQPPATSSAVVAQAWRGGTRQARLARLLGAVRIDALTPEVGRDLGVLLGRSGTADVVDAHVAWLAADGDVVFTSDPHDLERLLAARHVAAAVRRV